MRGMEEKKSRYLDMSLKKVYLEPTRMGRKKLEQRTATEYWTKKLVDIESYGGLSVREVLDGLHDGELELKPRDWTHILFHESGSNVTLLVEIKSIRFYRGHHGFFIHLGEVVKDYKPESEDEGNENDHVNV